MKTQILEQAKRRKMMLKTKSKNELTGILYSDKIYTASDAPKSWLIYDILKKEFNVEIADKIG